MSIQKFVRNYTNFNQWANRRIGAWLLSLDTACLYRPTLSSFPSIDLTVQHMVRTQKFWRDFVQEKDINHFDWSVKENRAAEMIQELMNVSDEMDMQFSSFGEEDLLKELQLDMPWAKNQLSRYEYIVHVVNHSTFHRGQIISIARSFGCADGIVNTDYNMYNTQREIKDGITKDSKEQTT